MIGVVTHARDRAVAEELFELFKTPWEPAQHGTRYRILLVGAGADHTGYDADLVLLYGAELRNMDRRLRTSTVNGPADVQWGAHTLPVYGGLVAFDAAGALGATCDGRAIEIEVRSGARTIHRIGYDLFGEVRRLLTEGQPSGHALAPTLELHISMLRSILERAGVPFLEIAPRPYGYDFTCCLTHDLDFFGIRRHGLDRTLAGFVYRSTLGSVVDLLRGRRTWREAIANWAAFLKLPLVMTGLLRDPWRPFDNYAAAESPEQSTFFAVPFRDHAGVAPDGVVHRARAVRYQASDVADEINAAVRRGSEMALHGIDAWHDTAAAEREARELLVITGNRPAGVRMHWLYFDQGSPARLEAAGFSYDSTCGYNDAVGFRAGTAQVFRPQGCKRLLELPLSIMDSALMFPNRMNMAPNAAAQLAATVVSHTAQFGGVLVVNWHDRSLAPERLWGRTYQTLLTTLRDRHRVWFATAGQAVDWFRWRRAIQFVRHGDSIRVTAPQVTDQSSPAAVLTIHGPAPASAAARHRIDPGGVITVPFSSALSAAMSCQPTAI